MHLTFYADGIRLDEGRFRPYAERATKAFMKDLSDGFFPSELQVNYLLTYKHQNMVVGEFQKKWRNDSQKTKILIPEQYDYAYSKKSNYGCVI